MTRFEDLDIAICGATQDEIPFALSKAQIEAKAVNKIIYVYENIDLSRLIE